MRILAPVLLHHLSLEERKPGLEEKMSLTIVFKIFSIKVAKCFNDEHARNALYRTPSILLMILSAC
jgi:hypothetical protein